jgi:type II secretory pathway pseudopilin PulG
MGKNMKKIFGFSLMEMTMVLLILGIVAFFGVRMIPKIISHGNKQERQAEFKKAENMLFNWLKQQPSLKLPATSGGVIVDGDSKYILSDSTGGKWGYLASPDLVENNACAISVAKPLEFTEHFSATDSQIANVAFVLYSNDPVFLQNYADINDIDAKFGVHWYRRDTTYNFTDREMLLRVVTFQELHKILNCPSVAATATPYGKVINLRSATTGQGYANNHQIQFYNGVNYDNVSYCFERTALSTEFTIEGASVMGADGCDPEDNWTVPTGADSVYLHASAAPVNPSVESFKAYAKVANSDAVIGEALVFEQEFVLVVSR